MNCNVGKLDRIIRLILGIALLAYAYMNLNYIIGGIGAIALITGILNRCPLYGILKLNTGCVDSSDKE